MRVRHSGCSPARMARWRSGARNASRISRRRCEDSGAAWSEGPPRSSRDSIWCAVRSAATRTGSALRGRGEAARTSVRPLRVVSRSGSLTRTCTGLAGSTLARSPVASRPSIRRSNAIGGTSSMPSCRTSIRTMRARGSGSSAVSSGNSRRSAVAMASSSAGPETRRGTVSPALRRAPCCCSGAEGTVRGAVLAAPPPGP